MERWILFFYSVPSKPVSNRMTVWRKLLRVGAIPLKGAVYILPFSPEHHELLLWLVAEIKAMGGDAAVVSIAKVDTIADGEIVDLFQHARTSDYLAIGNGLEEVERKLNNLKKGGQGQSPTGLAAELEKIGKAFADIQKIDFFAAAAGLSLRTAIERAQDEVSQLGAAPRQARAAVVMRQKGVADYQGRLWATRKRPFVDRMASAWLIKRFIDPDAAFAFIDEGATQAVPPSAIVFDVHGGEFTHVGDLCTFEVLIKAFGLKDKTLRLLAETVHDLDMKDAKYYAAEAKGVEQILSGIRKTASDDAAALGQGMQVFEMLYVAKKS